MNAAPAAAAAALITPKREAAVAAAHEQPRPHAPAPQPPPPPSQPVQRPQARQQQSTVEVQQQQQPLVSTGKYEWWTVDEVRFPRVVLPILIRHDGLFLSVRTIEYCILSQYDKRYKADIDQIGILCSFECNEADAALLNEINEYVNFAFGPTFTTQDALVKLDDFRNFFKVLTERLKTNRELSLERREQQRTQPPNASIQMQAVQAQHAAARNHTPPAPRIPSNPPAPPPPPSLQQSIVINQASILAAQQQQQRAQSIQNLAHPIQRQTNNAAASNAHLVDQLNRNGQNRALTVAYLAQQAAVNQAQAVNYGHTPHSVVDHGQQSFVGGHVSVPYSRPHLPPGNAQYKNVHQVNTSTAHIAQQQQHHQSRSIIRAAPPPPPMNSGLARHHNQIISNGHQQQQQHAIVVHNGRVQESHNLQRHAANVTPVPQPIQALSRSATGSFHEQHQQQLLRTLQMQQQQMQMAAAQAVQQAHAQRQAVQAAQQTQQLQQQASSLSHALANFQIANLAVTPPPPPLVVTNGHSPRGLTPPGPVPVSLLQQPVRNQPDFILHPVNNTQPPQPPPAHRTSPSSSSSLSNGHGGSPRDRSPIPPPPCLLSAASSSGTGLPAPLNSRPPQPPVVVVAKPPPPLEPIAAPPRRASTSSSLPETRAPEATPAAARHIDSARSSRGSSLDVKSDALRLVAAASSTPNRTASNGAADDEDVIFLETTTRTDPDRSTSLLSTTVSSCSSESRASSVVSRSSSLSSGAEAKKAGCIQINSKFFPYLMLANLAPLSFLKPDGKYSNKYVEIDHVIRLDVVQLNSSASLDLVFSTLYQTNAEETLYLKQFVTKINYPYKDFYMGKQSFLMVNLNEILFYASARPVFVKGLDYQQPMGKFLVHFEEVQEIKGGILSLNLESSGREGKLVPYVFTKGKKLIALEFIRAELDKIGEQTGLKLDPKKLDIFQVNTHAHKVFFRFFKMLLYYVDQKLEIAGKVNKYIDISECIASCPKHFESILRFSPEFFPMEWPNVLANRLSFIPRPADPNNPNKSAAGATTIIQVSPADQPITTNTPELQEDEAGHAEPAAVATKTGPAPFAAQNYLESVSFSPTSLCSMSPSISPQEAARSGGNGGSASGGDSNPASGVEKPEPAIAEPSKASEPARTTEEPTRPLETDNDNHSTTNHYSPISSAASSDDEEEMNISPDEPAPVTVQEPVTAPVMLPEPVVESTTTPEPPQTMTTTMATSTEPSEPAPPISNSKNRVRSFSDSMADCPSMRDFLAIQQRRQEPGEAEALEAGVLSEALDMVRKFKEQCSSFSSASHVQEMMMESEPQPAESRETPVQATVEQSPVDVKPTIQKRATKRSNTAKKRTAVYVSPARNAAAQQNASAADAHGYNEFIDSFGVRKTTTTTTTRTKRKRQDSKRLAQKRPRRRTQTRRGNGSANGSWYENDDDDDFIDDRSSFGSNDYEDVSSESTTGGSERSRSPTVRSSKTSTIDKLFRGKSDLYSTEEFDEDFYAKKYGYRQFVPEFRMRRVDDLQPINSAIKIADLPAYTSDKIACSFQAASIQVEPPKETAVPPKPKVDEDSATTPKEPAAPKKTVTTSKPAAEAPVPPKKVKAVPGASTEPQLSKKPPKTQTPGKTPAKKTALTATTVASPTTEPSRLERIKVEYNGSFTHELMAERPTSSAVPTLTAHDQVMSKSSRAATIPTSKLPPGALTKTSSATTTVPKSTERLPTAPAPSAPSSTLTNTTAAAADAVAVVATPQAKKTVLVASKPALVDEDSSGLPDLEL